jgi:hypothetical protein
MQTKIKPLLRKVAPHRRVIIVARTVAVKDLSAIQRVSANQSKMRPLLCRKVASRGGRVVQLFVKTVA